MLKAFKYIFNRKASLTPSLNDGSFDIKKFRPLSDCFLHSAISNKIISSPIIGLLFHCAPFAILRRIISIIVDSINGMFWSWPFSHIFKEVFKRIKPLIADRDTTTSVVMKVRVTAIQASGFHCLPRDIFRRSPHAMGFSGYACFGGNFFSKASAAFGSSRLNEAGYYGNFIPATANAIPVYFITNRFFSFRYYSQSIKCFSGKVNKCRHNILRWILLRMERAVEAGTESGVRSLNLSTAEGTS